MVHFVAFMRAWHGEVDFNEKKLKIWKRSSVGVVGTTTQHNARVRLHAHGVWVFAKATQATNDAAFYIASEGERNRKGGGVSRKEHPLVAEENVPSAFRKLDVQQRQFVRAHVHNGSVRHIATILEE